MVPSQRIVIMSMMFIASITTGQHLRGQWYSDILVNSWTEDFVDSWHSRVLRRRRRQHRCQRRRRRQPRWKQ